MEKNLSDGKPRILVAEDTESHSELMQMILKDFDVDTACNGREALNKVRANKYSLVFMDIKMPEMDGLEATRQIRTFDKETPIVALTAYAYEIERDHALEAGCNDHVAKPFKKGAITVVLKKFGLCQ